jgi:hypothetical protein
MFCLRPSSTGASVTSQLMRIPPFLVKIAAGNSHDCRRMEDMTLVDRSSVDSVENMVDLWADFASEDVTAHSGKAQVPDRTEEVDF